MTTIEKVLEYFNPEDKLVVKTQVESRMNSSQIKLLINLLEAAADKSEKDTRATIENEELEKDK